MKMVVGYDGSKNAKAALARAAELTKNSEGELVIVIAANVPIPAPYAIRSYNEQVRSDMANHAKTLLAEALDLAK